jgi:hypothetical protein
MDFWTQDNLDPVTFMSTEVPYGRKTRYDMCKKISVEVPNIAAAQTAIARIKDIDYNLFSRNCRTDTVEILQAYGVSGLPGGARPSGFFGGVSAEIIPLTAAWPGLGLDFSLYSEPDQFGLRDDPDVNQDGYVADPSADENPNGPDWPAPFIGSILVRRGYLALYEKNGYQGEIQLVPAGSVFNFRQLPWPEQGIGSWYASVTDFDASAIPGLNVTPRFSGIDDRRDHQRQLGSPPFFSTSQQRQGVLGH